MRCRWTSRLLRIFFGRAVDVAYEAFRVPVTNATPAGLKQFPWRWTLDSVPGCIRPASSNRSRRRRGCRSRQDHNLGNCPCRNRASAPDPRLTQISFRKRASPSQGGGIDDKRMQLREAFVRRVFAYLHGELYHTSPRVYSRRLGSNGLSSMFSGPGSIPKDH